MSPTKPPGKTAGKPHLHVAQPQPQRQETRVFSYNLDLGSHLVLMDGERQGKPYPIVKKVVTIGRDADADIVLVDSDVSSWHAEIVRDGATFLLKDAGSRNGVEFRGELIDEVPLANGDEFSICRNRFRFLSSDLEEESDILEREENTEVTAPRQPPLDQKKRRIVLASVAVALFAVGAYLMAGSSSVEVTVASVKLEPLEQSTSFGGRLVPRSEVRVFATVSAPVIELFVAEGDKVEKGDRILALDPEILGMAFEKAKAEISAAHSGVRAADSALKSAERKLREDRALARKGILSRSEVEASIARVNARRSDRSNTKAKQRLAETALAQAKRDHADTVVRAPIAGQVTTINIKVGEAPRDLRGLPVATIEDASELLAEITASESKIGLLRPGQVASLRVTGAGFGRELEGKVVQIAPRAERPMSEGAATRYIAKVALTAQDDRLRAGMQVQVKIVTAAKEAALTVPLTAMVTSGQSERGSVERVAVVQPNGRVRWVAVETDLIGTDRVEVLSGLEEGASVVTGPVDILLNLENGSRVSIRSN